MIAMPMPTLSQPSRRAALHTALRNALLLPLAGVGHRCLAQDPGPQDARQWYEHAARMRDLAVSRGDQPYGAALVLNGKLIVAAPSRVIGANNPDAHAEREAIRDAQRLLGRQDLSGAVLYSTSRPCGLCEEAAFKSRVARMYHGPDRVDAGAPRSARR